MTEQTARPPAADSVPVTAPRALHEIEAAAGPAAQPGMTAPASGTGREAAHGALVWAAAILGFVAVAVLFGAAVSVFL